MSPHPSDPVVANLIRHARVGEAASPSPTRTRQVGEHSARQHSVGSLVLEASRADGGVSEEAAQARREVIAAEFERRRMVEAAEEARRRAEFDRALAEREREETVTRARQQGGPDPDLLTLALIAATTREVSDGDLVGVVDAAVTDHADVSTSVDAALAGERRVGLTPDQLTSELGVAGGSSAIAEGVPHTGVDSVSPAVLVGESLESSASAEPVTDSAVEPEESPEIG